ncbi:MAG TPA: type IV toxin-antitoxin system AbiEi family antitoxin domain-containing protein [Nocardioidaceae bacterium]|nr:type IV toxin-antitoxin system AbiEi family antitoxin domain-containing protein [Nocardioidaceae bacterium]
MHPDLAAVAASHNGVFLRRDAVRCGYTDDEISRLVRRQEWYKLRRGAYCERALLANDTHGDLEAFLRTQACALVLAPPAFASHSSASSVLELPRWGTRPDECHFTRPSRHAGRREAGVIHHEAHLGADETTMLRGVRTTSLERTPLDVSREFGFAPGLVAADAALRKGADPAMMAAIATGMKQWADARPVQAVLGFADGGGHSPGETLTRIAAREAGLHNLTTQFEVRDGCFLAYVDVVAPDWNLALEFDGRLKYRRTRDKADPATDDADIVWAEKMREDRLSDLGFEVLRVVWADLFGGRRVLLIRRIQQAAERGRRRSPGIAALLA